jgi:hypothetical protein
MVTLQCIGCRTDKVFPDFDPYPVCDDCKRWEAYRKEKMDAETKSDHTCSLCGYVGPAIDRHHIHGRKNSNVTIKVCANCHRELHAGVRSL